MHTVKPVLRGYSKRSFQDRLLPNAGQKYCRMLKESILQSFPPSLSYQCLYFSGRLRQVWLYFHFGLVTRKPVFGVSHHFIGAAVVLWINRSPCKPRAACLIPCFSCLSYETFVKWPLSKRPKNVFQDLLILNAGQNIAECSKGSIWQYFRPSLSYHLSLRLLLCIFLSGCFTQVLLYFF